MGSISRLKSVNFITEANGNDGKNGCRLLDNIRLCQSASYEKSKKLSFDPQLSQWIDKKQLLIFYRESLNSPPRTFQLLSLTFPLRQISWNQCLCQSMIQWKIFQRRGRDHRLCNQLLVAHSGQDTLKWNQENNQTTIT